MIKNAPCRTASQLGHLLQRILRVYARAGFRVQTIMMDNEFNKVRDHIPEININTPVAAKHVGEIEHKIQGYQGTRTRDHLYPPMQMTSLHHADPSHALRCYVAQ